MPATPDACGVSAMGTMAVVDAGRSEGKETSFTSTNTLPPSPLEILVSCISHCRHLELTPLSMTPTSFYDALLHMLGLAGCVMHASTVTNIHQALSNISDSARRGRNNSQASGMVGMEAATQVKSEVALTQSRYVLMSQVCARSAEIGNCRSGCCDTSRASCWIASCAALCAGFSASCTVFDNGHAHHCDSHGCRTPCQCLPA